MRWYWAVLQKYFVAEGRARRKEYWMFVLLSFVFVLLLQIIEVMLGIAPDTEVYVLATTYELAIAIPGLMVGIRRMHDIDRSGWFVIIPFYNFYLCCLDGTSGDNRFGPDPKAGPQQGSVAGVQTATSGQEGAPARPAYVSQPHIPVNPPVPSVPGALDIRLTERITQTQAAQGGSVRVVTGTGEEVELMIPPGTTSGTHLKVSGGGRRQDNQVGDVWVRIEVEG